MSVEGRGTRVSDTRHSTPETWHSALDTRHSTRDTRISPKGDAIDARQETIAQRLAGFVSGLSLEQVPAGTLARAKLLLLDAIGVALAASSFEFGRRAVKGLATLGPGTARVIGLPERLPLRDAVLANGILTHGLDFDDTSIVARIHPSSFCMPAALTLSAELGSSGAQMLGAYIAGMEAAIVTTKDGRIFERREDVHRGSPERPLTQADIIAKFMDNGQRALGRDTCKRVREAVLDIEALRDAKALAEMLSPA